MYVRVLHCSRYLLREVINFDETEPCLAHCFLLHGLCACCSKRTAVCVFFSAPGFAQEIMVYAAPPTMSIITSISPAVAHVLVSVLTFTV